jgi:hypothetical protein
MLAAVVYGLRPRSGVGVTSASFSNVCVSAPDCVRSRRRVTSGEGIVMDGTSGHDETAFNVEDGKRFGNGGHSSIFTRAEVREALGVLASPEEADAITATLYDDPDPGPDFFYGDLLTALAIISESAAQRVRELLSETEAEEAERIARFRREYRLG